MGLGIWVGLSFGCTIDHPLGLYHKWKSADCDASKGCEGYEGYEGLLRDGWT